LRQEQEEVEEEEKKKSVFVTYFKQTIQNEIAQFQQLESVVKMFCFSCCHYIYNQINRSRYLIGLFFIFILKTFCEKINCLVCRIDNHFLKKYSKISYDKHELTESHNRAKRSVDNKIRLKFESHGK